MAVPEVDARPVGSWGWQRETAATLGVGLGVAALCLVLAAWDPNFFWHDDCQIGSVPEWVEVHRALTSGEWPLLSPYAWANPVLAAEYQPGAFSPVVLAIKVFAVSVGGTMAGIATAFGAMTLGLVAMGGFRLARGEGLAPAFAALVGVVAALNGWNVAWSATNWSPSIMGFMALLWSWWALAGAVRPGAGPGRTVLAGVMVGLLLTAGWPHSVFGALLVTAWLALRAAFEARSWRPLPPLVIAWTIGLGLSAPAWMLFVDYLGGTIRRLDTNLQWDWIVPPLGLAGLVLPAVVTKWSTFWGWVKLHIPIELVNGLAPTGVLAAMLATAGRGLPKAVVWPLGFAAFLLTISMLPSYGMVRWSFRWLPLFHVAATLAAAWWLFLRSEAEGPRRPSWASPSLWAAGLVAVCGVIALDKPVLPFHLTLAYMAIAVAWVVVDLGRPARDALRRWAPVGVCVGVFLATYMVVPVHVAVPTWLMTEDIRKPAPFDPTIRYIALADKWEYILDGQLGWGRPNWGVTLRPGNTPQLAGIEFVNGYTALHTLAYERAFPSETHGWWEPLAIDRTARRRAGPTGLLARLGVDGMVIGKRVSGYVPIVAAQGWEVTARTPDGTVLRRKGPPSPRVASYEAIRHVDMGDLRVVMARLEAPDGLPIVAAGPGRPAGEVSRYARRAVELVRFGRHAVEVDVAPGDGPALVAIRRMWVPGWQAELDGRPLPLLQLDSMVPAVEVPAGAGGRLTLFYRPTSLVAGLATAAATGAATLFGWLWLVRRRRRA